MAATIAWVSDGEQAKPRRRRGRRRGRRAAGPPESTEHLNNTAVGGAKYGAVQSDKHQPSGQNKPQKSRQRRPADRLRTVHETSAGGLVIDGIDGPKETQVAALIGRIDRRGRMLWSLPKGHIELGETAEQTAIREVAEETGIQGSVLAALGSIDYWFVTEGRRVHKTVHHYLMRFLGGEPINQLEKCGQPPLALEIRSPATSRIAVCSAVSPRYGPWAATTASSSGRVDARNSAAT